MSIYSFKPRISHEFIESIFVEVKDGSEWVEIKRVRILLLKFREFAFIAQIFIVGVGAGQVAIHTSAAVFIARGYVTIGASLGIPFLEFQSDGLIGSEALSVVEQTLR